MSRTAGAHATVLGPALDPNSADPVVRALARARVGAPMTPEERRAKTEAFAGGSWADGEQVRAEIASPAP
ncbi:MAG: hypothetical protein R2724_34000 [Bryobacterales bacterium]